MGSAIMIPSGESIIIRNCIIDNIEYRDAYDHLTFSILNEKGEKQETVRVYNRGIHQDLRLLLAHPGGRLFWAYGMTDVDVWREDENSFAIEVSPCDGIYTTYIVNKSELEKLLNEGEE